MLKLKTKKSVAKRFRITKSGKVKYYPGGKGHLASSKKHARIRRLKKTRILEHKKEVKYLKRLLPYR